MNSAVLGSVAPHREPRGAAKVVVAAEEAWKKFLNLRASTLKTDLSDPAKFEEVTTELEKIRAQFDMVYRATTRLRLDAENLSPYMILAKAHPEFVGDRWAHPIKRLVDLGVFSGQYGYLTADQIGLVTRLDDHLRRVVAKDPIVSDHVRRNPSSAERLKLMIAA